jgi:dihydrofolate reductase
MTKVIVDKSMSLDGFVTGPNVSVENPMGEGGPRLHEWLFTDSPNDIDVEIGRDVTASTGAVVLGRRIFDVGLNAWGDTPFPVPTFVLTHRPRDPLVMQSGTFTFVTDGLKSAIDQAKAAAGNKDVRVMGADVSQQAVKAGLVDELNIQLVPVLLGSGTRLFENLGTEHIELTRVRVVESTGVTHLRFTFNSKD